MCNKLTFPRLFITDLDDTALGGGFRPYSRFPDVFSGFLDSLMKHGCNWATNTTWDVNPQAQLIFASSVKSRPIYLVGGKGLQLCGMERDELIKIQPYSNQMNDRLEEVCRLYLRPLIKEICSNFDLKSISYNGFWFSAVAVDYDADALFSCIDEKVRLLDSLSFNRFPDKNQFSAFPTFLKKSDAVREILRITGIKPEEVMVAGDGIIDLDMMAEDLCGYVVCPDNANEDVKEWVRKRGGAIGKAVCGPGVVEAFGVLARQNGWEWDYRPDN